MMAANKPPHITNDEVIFQLSELFGATLDLETIRNVALNLNYDLDAVSNALLEMSEVPDIHKTQQNSHKDKEKPEFISYSKITTKKPTNNNGAVPKLGKNKNLNQNSSLTKNDKKFEELIHTVKKGYNVLILMRGCPGSGKTTLARKVVEAGLKRNDFENFIFSTDDFFINKRTKNYEFNSVKISEAHQYNQCRAAKAVKQRVSPVIIDNTNTQLWEMKCYVQLAVQHGYYIEVLEPFTSWKKNIRELTRRNIHGVPRSTIELMLQRYDEFVAPETLMQVFQLKYSSFNQPPTCRKFPEIPVESVGNSRVIGNGKLVDLISFEDNCLNSTSDVHNNFEPKNKKKCVNEFEKSRKSPNLDLHSWGITQNYGSLVSWNECNIETQDDVKGEVVFTSENKKLISTADAVTNTCSDDYNLIYNKNYCIEHNIQILDSKSRDISNGILSPKITNNKILLDKSSSTENDLFEATEINTGDINELMSLFPDIHVEYLRDIYEKCEKNLNWTVDILLDDNRELLPILVKEVPSTNSPITVVDNLVDPEIDVPESEMSIIDYSELQNFENYYSGNNISVQSEELKKLVEQSVVINKAHYSDHVLKIKEFKRGLSEFNNSEESFSSSASSDNLDSFNWPQQEFEEIDLMELNIGGDLVSQLENKFGRLDMIPEGFQPVVKIPVCLARQLHAYYVESIFNQMETQNQVLEMIVDEDEEFAKTLQIEEERQFQIASSYASKTPQTLDDIMNEQMTESLQLKELMKNPETLAIKLTLRKLENTFPSLGKDQIKEIYYAHNNSYEDTVDVLLSSIDKEDIVDLDGSFRSPPVTDYDISSMKLAGNALEKCLYPPDIEKTADEYREEAQNYFQKHHELIQQGRQAFQRKQYGVAQFYSEIAKKYTNLYEQSNCRAASAFLQANASRIQSPNTLDLHYLHVREALQALDMYIDTNISKLIESKKPFDDFIIITGWGKNSFNKQSKLKPAVTKRLKKRNIQVFLTGNRGCLRMRISINSVPTNDLN